MGKFGTGARFRRPAVAALAALGLSAALAATASAHHSYAVFDGTKKVEVQGTVKEWQFTNPHTWLQVMVVENGAPVEYSIEGSSVNTLARRGWNPKTFKPGDKVTVLMNPLRDGGKGGSFILATLADGRVLSQANVPQPGAR
jgi:hypothetical protein